MTIEVVRDTALLRAAIRTARLRGARVGFVPTMGALHAGHLSLIDRVRESCDCVVLSIFVNPLQFAPTDDLSRYPRTEADDLAAAARHGVTIAFVPSAAAMYDERPVVSVSADALADVWEGAVRPGHFAGVLTVVCKLFNLVQPDLAVFGQKDLQQATLIRAMARDLNFPVVLDVAPIVRESDGLAMSSRNRYLDPSSRIRARGISRALAAMVTAFQAGERGVATLDAIGREHVPVGEDVRIDYLTIVEPDRMAQVTTAAMSDSIIAAVKIGTTRLLDNHRLGDPLPVFT